MTTEQKKTADSRDKKITFKCKFCEKIKPLSDIVVVTRYFPAVVICKDCEKNLR